VALALFGIAASGVYVFVAGDRLAVDLRGELAKATRRFAAGALVAVAYAMANPMDIIIVTGSNAIPEFTSRQAWQLIFLVGITAIPFFYAGMVVSLALSYLRQDTNRVYAWDLAGAAAAALLIGVVLSLVGGPTAVLVALALALVAAALFEAKGNARWVWVAAGVGLVAWNLARPIIRVPTTKGVKVETTRFEQWNAFSRVTVDDTRTIRSTRAPRPTSKICGRWRPASRPARSPRSATRSSSRPPRPPSSSGPAAGATCSTPCRPAPARSPASRSTPSSPRRS